MKLESDKDVVYDGSCSECEQCLRLYRWDAEAWEGISVWRTWSDRWHVNSRNGEAGCEILHLL